MLTCEQFRDLAGLVLEGEDHPDAHSHLQGCPRCQRLREELLWIQRTARTLPRQEPDSHLWERLEVAAQKEGLWTSPAWGRFTGLWGAWLPLPARPALAGAFLVAVAALLVAGGYPVARIAEENERVASPYEVARAELVREAEYGTRYQVHLNQVQSEVLEDARFVEPELRELVVPPLDTLDRAIGQTQVWLTDYPDDPLARAELLRLYRQKATALQAMSDMAWQNASY